VEWKKVIFVQTFGAGYRDAADSLNILFRFFSTAIPATESAQTQTPLTE